MAKILKIGLDLDDVCVDFLSAFRKEAEIVLGRKIFEEAVDWSCSNWGLTDSDRKKLWDRILNTPFWFARNCTFILGAILGIHELDDQHEITFITARPPTRDITARQEALLQLNNFGIDLPQVIVSHKKGPIVANLKLDLFVDDRVENLKDIESCSPETKLVVYDHPHNREGCSPNWKRVHNWTELLAYIKELD